MKCINGIDIPRTLDELADPARTALLIYDMQAGICGQLAEGPRIVNQCKIALEAARSSGMRVVHTRHLSAPKAWMGATQLRTAMTWQRTDDPETVKPWFLRDSPPFAIAPELAPRPDELVLDKLAMSAFEGTPLAFALKDCGIVGLAICGIALEIGIEPTTRHATDLGFIPIVLEDACGAGDPEAGRRTLETIRYTGEALVTSVDDFARMLAGDFVAASAP